MSEYFVPLLATRRLVRVEDESFFKEPTYAFQTSSSFTDNYVQLVWYRGVKESSFYTSLRSQCCHVVSDELLSPFIPKAFNGC